MLRDLLWERSIEHETSSSVYFGPSWNWVADWSGAIVFFESLQGAGNLANIKHIMVDYSFPEN